MILAEVESSDQAHHLRYVSSYAVLQSEFWRACGTAHIPEPLTVHAPIDQVIGRYRASQHRHSKHKNELCCVMWSLDTATASKRTRARPATHMRPSAPPLLCPTRCDILPDTRGSSAGSRNSRREHRAQQLFLKLSCSQHPLPPHHSRLVYLQIQAMDQSQALPQRHRCL